MFRIVLTLLGLLSVSRKLLDLCFFFQFAFIVFLFSFSIQLDFQRILGGMVFSSFSFLFIFYFLPLRFQIEYLIWSS
jgi:hypothetical protein